MLGVSVKTLQGWRCNSAETKPLKYVKVGRLVRYEEREILKYLERKRSA